MDALWDYRWALRAFELDRNTMQPDGVSGGGPFKSLRLI